MNNQELYHIEKVSNDSLLTCATSYINPISYLPTIETDLAELNFNGEVVFDLLLCNGYGFNRFVKCTVREGKFDRQGMKVISSLKLEEAVLSKAHDFYRVHNYLVDSNQILTTEEKSRCINYG